MGLLDFFRQRPAGEQPAPRKGLTPDGSSGRAHTGGFIEFEELNQELIHPLSHRVYDRMYRTDADVHQVVNLLSNPITGGTWHVEPHGGEKAEEKDRKIAEDLEWALFDVMEPNLIGHLIEFLPILFRSGFAPGEIIWRTADREGKTLLVPGRVDVRLPRSIYRWVQQAGELKGIWQNAPGGDTGAHDVFMPRRNLVYYRVGGEGDNWEGVSLLRPAFKHWKLKDAIERIDAIAQEKEAMGTPIVYPPPGATDAQLDEMESALQAMRTNEQAYIVMPGMKAGDGAPDGSGWRVEILGYERTGSGRDPQPSLAYHSNKIAASLMAEFMRLGHGQTGARATAQVQADPFLMGVEAVVGIVEQELNRSLVLPFIAYNHKDVHDPPRLRMSLVDSTSLSQLADFVLKLTQVGALLPDRELEDFLRARADMPPMNSKLAQERETEEDDIRRRIVGGLDEPNADPFGSNAPVGEHKNGKPAGDGLKRAKGRKPGAPMGRGGAGQNPEPRGPAKNLEGVWLSHDAVGREDLWSRHHHDTRWWELMVELDDLEDLMDDAPLHFAGEAGLDVYTLVREMADEADSPLGEPAPKKSARISLEQGIEKACREMYDSGAAFLRDEIMGQREAYGMDDFVLDRGARDRGVPHLQTRARAAAARVEAEVRHALLGSDLSHGQRGRGQMLAEKAGMVALKRAGMDHGVAALIHGRHDEAVRLLAEGQPIVTARYTAKLDRGTCPECRDADDDVPRALDDPVRLERQPPNPHCHSLASGANRCRCIEVFEINPPVRLDDIAPEAELPPYLRRIVNLLVARGMQPIRAISVAINVARTVARTGKVRWPGLRQVGAGDRSEAAEAVLWWETSQAG